MKLGLVCTATCAGFLLLADGATAADVYSPVTPEAQQIVTEEGWTFSVAPYFWAAGISGEVGQFGLPPVDVDASFSDIFDHLDFGAMAIAEARYDRYSIFGDIMYSTTSTTSGSRARQTVAVANSSTSLAWIQARTIASSLRLPSSFRTRLGITSSPNLDRMNSGSAVTCCSTPSAPVRLRLGICLLARPGGTRG
jgi:hypothetical protein